MAARFEQDYENPVECANCGETVGLMRCSRCKQVYYCSAICQKAYWSFHKQQCKRNEFADILESQDDKFAGWMRRHGKMAVLRDDQVHRLEAAQSSDSRQQVMESMYGTINPQPKSAQYSLEEKIKMDAANEKENDQVYFEDVSQERQWQNIQINSELGLDCRRYKWRQNQTFVEIFVRLPPKISRQKVQVVIQPGFLQVKVDDENIIIGDLFQNIKAEDSTWIVGDENILEIILLKANRRGRYQDGTSNADTFWFSLLQYAPKNETMQLAHPPTSYYFSYIDEEDLPPSISKNQRNQQVQF